MSGLLDKKSRILDYIVTDLGRSELTKGEFNIAYVGFSDIHSIYEKDLDFDQTAQLLGFEAASLPSDLVITDLDNDGLVMSVNMTQGRPADITQLDTVDPITVSNFNTFIDNIAKPIQNHFLITNKQQFADRDEFLVSPQLINFDVTNKFPLKTFKDHNKNLNAVPNIFQDDDFKTKPNFKFLPPVNKNNSPVFEFDDITAKQYLKNSSEIVEEIKNNKKQTVTIQFSETTEDNQVIIQFFEKSSVNLKKLKIVAHQSEDGDDSNNVYFIGKTFKDARGIESFIKIFTMVIHK